MCKDPGMATTSDSATLKTSLEILADLRNDPASAALHFAPLAKAAADDPAIRERIQDHRRFITIVAAEAWADS
jgi:hypothetical protein